MVTVRFNDQPESIASIEDFGIALDRFDRSPKFEIWLSVEGGPSICMLRNGKHAWLMYLRFEGDSGFVPNADPDGSKEVDAADIDLVIAGFGGVDE